MKTTTLVQVGGARSGKWLSVDGSVRVIAVPVQGRAGFAYVATRVSDDSDVATGETLAEIERKIAN